MERFLSAPSKLFLTGEYAVLWGGTARIAAVPPRGEAYVRRRDDREVHLVLEEGRVWGYCTPRGVNWSQTVPDTFSFACHALDEVLRAHGRETLGFEVALSAPRLRGERKLGLGAAPGRQCLRPKRRVMFSTSVSTHSNWRCWRTRKGSEVWEAGGMWLRFSRAD